jgi:GT2 family glycosyltransferase
MQIDIVIPNWNGKNLLRACLDSLKQQVHKDFAVIVVDNGSSDGSQELLQNNYPEVQLIAWPENRGFSVAVNAGIEASTAPLIFLLNNDTELHKDCLHELTKAAAKQKQADFFATKMLNYHHRDMLDGAGDAFLRGGVGYRIGTMEMDSDLYTKQRQVFGVCAGAALYRREMLEDTGCFDEDFFAYLEDVDLNLRANSRGKKCWYVPEAQVYHVGSATTGSKINDFTVSLSTRNNFNILLKNYPLTLFLRFAPVIVIYQFFWLCFVVKKKQISAYCKGLWSFVVNAPKIYAKRKSNLAKQTVSNNQLAAIMSSAENDVIESIMARRHEQGKGNLLFSIYKKIFL